MSRILKHFKDWAEVWFWLPACIILIQVTAALYYLLTGRQVVDDPWSWVVGFCPQLVKCILAIALVSIFVEQTGTWMPYDEQLRHPFLAAVKNVTKIIALCAFLYALSH